MRRNATAFGSAGHTASAPSERPSLHTVDPWTHFVAGEPLRLLGLPALGCFELQLRGRQTRYCECLRFETNELTATEGLPPGRYLARVRWQRGDDELPEGEWSAWSLPLELYIHPRDEEAQVRAARAADHRLALACARDEKGLVTIYDPWLLPPAFPDIGPETNGESTTKTGPRSGHARWFPTPCYEGATMLLNEERSYYCDPLAYYLDAIDALVQRGARFVNWHDVLEGRLGRSELEIMLQFDVDGGPRSMARLYPLLRSREIVATVMIHRTATGWYEYDLDQIGIELLQEAESFGWVVGYHHNTLTILEYAQPTDVLERERMELGRSMFADDVDALRRHFDVRTFTHHGGNSPNHRIEPPGGLDIVCVDKPAAPALWRAVRSMFSDGGFLARPTSLRRYIEELPPGLHFLRNHPLKYANFMRPFDVPPLSCEAARRAGYEVTPALAQQIAEGQTKQRSWLADRNRKLFGRRLSYPRLDRPLSGRFRSDHDLSRQVDMLTDRDSAHASRFPWPNGNPERFWWRMIASLACASRRILTVGCSTATEREVLQTLVPNAEPSEAMDRSTAPHGGRGSTLAQEHDVAILWNIDQALSPTTLPLDCLRRVRSKGLLLLRLPSDTHRQLGGLFHPRHRPVWRPGAALPALPEGAREPSATWSFDAEAIQTLVLGWPPVEVEFFAHYWFIACRKDA